MVAIPFNSQEGQLQYTACSFVLEVPATECDEQLFIYANLPDYQFEFFDTGKSTCQFIQKCKETFPHLERSQTPSSITNLLSVWEQQNVHIDWILENDPSVLVDKYNMDSAFLNYYDRDEDRVHLLGKFLKRRDQTKIHFTFNCIFELTEDAFLQFPTDHYFSSHSSLQNYQLITINLYDTDASFCISSLPGSKSYSATSLRSDSGLSVDASQPHACSSLWNRRCPFPCTEGSPSISPEICIQPLFLFFCFHSSEVVSFALGEA